MIKLQTKRPSIGVQEM